MDITIEGLVAARDKLTEQLQVVLDHFVALRRDAEEKIALHGELKDLETKRIVTQSALQEAQEIRREAEAAHRNAVKEIQDLRAGVARERESLVREMDTVRMASKSLEKQEADFKERMRKDLEQLERDTAEVKRKEQEVSARAAHLASKEADFNDRVKKIRKELGF